MEEFKKMFGDAVSCIYGKTKKAADITKLSLEIEREKCRLSRIYEKIGEAVVSGSLASGSGEEKIFKYIDEAKTVKEKLCELKKQKENI